MPTWMGRRRERGQEEVEEVGLKEGQEEGEDWRDQSMSMHSRGHIKTEYRRQQNEEVQKNRKDSEEYNKTSNTYLVCCPHIPPKKELPEEPPGFTPEEEEEVVGVFCFPPV